MKRAVAFLLLLGLGFLLLRLALGDERIATAGGATTGKDGDPVVLPHEPDRGPPIHRNADGTEVRVRGGFTIAPYRDVPAASGVGTDRQQIYELTCQDCVPTGDGRHRLDDVLVKLFDRGVHTADLAATRALVELDVDDRNQRTLRENRELELEHAVLTSVPGLRATQLRLEVGRVRAIVGSDLIALHTPDDNEPVRLVTGGEREGELRGRGVRARLPKDASPARGRLDLQILHDPSIALAGLDLRADGELHYVEQLATGAALVTVADNVRVDLADARPSAAVALPGTRPANAVGPPASGGIQVRGDRMHGWLQRSSRGGDRPGQRPAQRDELVWTMLRLLGSRARVTTGAVELESPRLTVLPGPTGLLASITADGGPSELRQLGGGATFRSSRPIHLVRVGESIGAVYRTFGFPSFGLGPLADFEIVTFEGAADVDAGDGVRVAADRGLHLFRQPRDAASGYFVARGFGNVVISHGIGDDRIEARGDSGFLLWRTATGDEIALGKNDVTANQPFTLTRGQLVLHGNGRSRMVRSPDGRVQVWLQSDRPTIDGTFVDSPVAGDAQRPGGKLRGELRHANSLDIVVQQREVSRFLATGPATEFELSSRGRRMLASAARIEQTSASSWRLTGPPDAPARLRQPPMADGRAAELLAPRIDLYRVAARSLLVDALGRDGVPARVEARSAPDDGVGGDTVVATADRVRMLPYAVGPAALVRQLVGMPAGIADIVAGSIAQPWLLAEGDVVADIHDRRQGELHGEGQVLVTSQGASGALLVGDVAAAVPAVLHRSEHGQRTLSAAGARVQFSRTDTDRITILTTFPGRTQLVPPRVTFRTSANGDDRLGWLRGECRGEIEIVPDGVLFHGPVIAHSLLPSGNEDPTGLYVTAEQLHMSRQRETGELTKVDAGGGVSLRWRDMVAYSQRVELDLRWQRCIADDPSGATIRFGDGLSYRARRLEANYATYAVRSYNGRIVQEAVPAAERR